MAESRKAIERALPFIEEKGVAWMSDRGCVTCHQTTFLIWTHAEAKRRGFSLDERKLSEWTNWALLKVISGEDGSTSQGADTFSQLLLGRDARAVLTAKPAKWHRTIDPYENVLKDLLKDQTADGRWIAGGQSGNPDAIPTAWAVLALAAREELLKADSAVNPSKNLGPGLNRIFTANSEALPKARDKSLAWLESVEPGKPGVTGTIYEGKPTGNPDTLNERLVLRLLVARKFGKPKDADERLKELLARQAADGGWSANPEVRQPSDAFATGQSLYALCLAGNNDEKVRDAVERACEFLMAKQERNGSWLVPTTAFHPSSGRPDRDRNTDEVYTYWGTAWATLGLLHTLPLPASVAGG